MISGTTGMLGCADGAFILQKERRTDSVATLYVMARDQPDQRIHLERNEVRLTWDFDHAERELWKETITQVSSSKKWKSLPALNEQGRLILQNNGKSVPRKPYSVL